MRFERTALELGMELDADEPGVVLPLHDLWKFAIGRHARKDQAALFQRVAVMNVDLIAVAVTLADFGRAILLGNLSVMAQFGRIGAEPHRTAHVGIGAALLQAFGAHPFRDEADYRFAGFAELGG
jgi:hypothetical protein